MTHEKTNASTLTGNSELVNSGFNHPPYNPLHLLQQWLQAAEQVNVSEPRGLVLSTVNANNRPSSRVVLLKTVNDTGAIFASSSVSKKGLDLLNNPYASGTLWWRETMQQINFYGMVTKVESHVSNRIWCERIIEAQAIAAVSHQSAPMIDEALLRQSVFNLINAKKEIERPSTWCGYRIEIQEIEFWHGSPDRFHNRLHYNLTDGLWKNQKLQP